MENYLPTLAEFLEVEQVQLDDYFSSFDCWDSMTILMIIDFCMSEYGVTLSAEEIEDSETIRGLKELIESRA